MELFLLEKSVLLELEYIEVSEILNGISKTPPSITLNITFQLFILEHTLYCSIKNYVTATL